VITENPVRISNFLLGETDRGYLDAVKPLCSESQIGERNSVSVRRVCRGFTRPEAVFAEASQTSAPSACEDHLSGVALVSVVKSSNLRNHYDVPVFRLLHYSRLWGVLC
jgi:hypothetical protein